MGNEFKLSLKSCNRGIIPRCIEDVSVFWSKIHLSGLTSDVIDIRSDAANEWECLTKNLLLGSTERRDTRFTGSVC